MTATASLRRPGTAPDLAAVTAFVHGEIDLLDRREFEAWAELFTPDGEYWAPAHPDQTSPLDHVSLFYDDRRTMGLRIARLRHPRIYVQDPPSSTIHLTSNFRDLAVDDEGVRVRCNFAMFEFRTSKAQTIYGGTYDYRLRSDENGQIRIHRKTARLVNCHDRFPSLAVWF